MAEVAVEAAAGSAMARPEAADFVVVLVAVTEVKGQLAVAVPLVAPVPR